MLHDSRIVFLKHISIICVFPLFAIRNLNSFDKIIKQSYTKKEHCVNALFTLEFNKKG